MKNFISVLTLLFLLNSLLPAQENNFKPVYIAKDVVDNYITAIGGKDKIAKIHTVKIEGNINHLGMALNLTRYVGKDYYYQILQSNDFCEITAYNDVTHKGWYTHSGKAIDFDKKALKYYKSNGVNYFGCYVNGYELGIKCEFNNESNTDTSLYCINFYKKDKLYITMYFDKINFLKVKCDFDGQTRHFSDYRKIGECGILMPHVISASDTLFVDTYKFNQSFDKQLLNKESLKIFQP